MMACLNTSFSVKENSPSNVQRITIITDPAVSQKLILMEKIIAITKLATPHFLRQETFLCMKGLPFMRVLKIIFS